MSIISGFLDLLFPPRCVFCRKFLKKGENSVCSACRSDLPRTEGAQVSFNGEFFSECVSPFYYKGHVRDSLLRFKFKGMTNYAGEYGRILADCIRQNLSGRYDLITWAPLGAKRRAERTYDQAALLAMATALELDDVAAETLEKTDIPAQSGITGAEMRKANVSGAYSVIVSELVAGKRVLIIDDIFTTGSTLSECARVLLLAGAREVLCATMARTESKAKAPENDLKGTVL